MKDVADATPNGEMDILIIGQGLKGENKLCVGDCLVELLNAKDYHTFTGISAFASKSGINGLHEHFAVAKENFKKLSIIVGVNQRGTSKEALEAIRELSIEAYVFYHGKAPIFHPKIYLFEGDKHCKLVIGSSNLTSRGLYSNIETSIMVSIDNSMDSDRQIIKELKAYYKELFDVTDPNMQKLTTELIEEFVKEKIVPTEKERKEEQEKTDSATGEKTSELIDKWFPKRDKPKIPKGFRGEAKAKKTTTKKITGKTTTKKVKEVWKSRALTERDLNIPKGGNTNPTGSMFFSKGQMKNIDQRHYFRDEVFSKLKWVADTNARTAHYERAIIFINLKVKGKDCGIHELMVSHNTKTDTVGYKQNNSMTHISWGTAKKYIAKDELIGCIATLYSLKGLKDKFGLIIE